MAMMSKMFKKKPRGSPTRLSDGEIALMLGEKEKGIWERLRRDAETLHHLRAMPGLEQVKLDLQKSLREHARGLRELPSLEDAILEERLRELGVESEAARKRFMERARKEGEA